MAAALSAALALAPAPVAVALAQGIGLPNQNRGIPLEIFAKDGIEWHQKSKAYIARGDARAVQGEVTVYGDELTAYYRDGKEGGTEIWRIDAVGSVRIVSPTHAAYGDKAVYDIDNGVLVMTGRLRLVTGADTITARDSLEYWEKRSLAVARGNAIATRGDNRMRADVLTAHFRTNGDGKAEIKQIDAFDNVLISSPSDIVRAKQGVYDLETGIVTVTGSVKITRGENQLNGEYAEVNLNTGVSRLFGGKTQGVRGYFMPGEAKDGVRKGGAGGTNGKKGGGS